MKLILLNGPPGSGKSAAASILQRGSPQRAIVSYASPLKRSVHGVHLGDRGYEMPADAFEAIKDEPQPLLGGRSWRQEYIRHAENVIKPVAGREWYAKHFLKAARQTRADIVIAPDLGFDVELIEAVRDVGCTNLQVIRLHRGGRDFADDIRSYIHNRSVHSADIENNGSLGDLRTALDRVSIF